jgi:hypothetical protein
MFITKVLGTASGEGSVTPGRFLIYAGLTFLVAIVFTLIAIQYRYRDESAAHGR